MIIVDEVEKSPITAGQKITDLQVKNLIAAPIITRNGEFVAAVVVADKRGAQTFQRTRCRTPQSDHRTDGDRNRERQALCGPEPYRKDAPKKPPAREVTGYTRNRTGD